MKKVQQTFFPGSKWLYIKVYAGHKTLDKIISDDFSFVINKLFSNKKITKWFFVRYADPEPHLRLRFYMENELYSAEIINLVHRRLNYLIKDNLIWKLQIDTYNRELERYGGELIEKSELIFCIDSMCTMLILKGLNKLKNMDYRWMISLRMIDDLLSDFSFNLDSKQKLMNDLSESFKKEFGFNKYNSKIFNSKFRENKSIVESILRKEFEDSDFEKLYLHVKNRSKQLSPLITELTIKLEHSDILVTLNDLVTSYIHMMLNRLFTSKNRIYELILYDFMKRHYTSEIARSSSNDGSSTLAYRLYEK